jgi:hypothetical protein
VAVDKESTEKDPPATLESAVPDADPDTPLRRYLVFAGSHYYPSGGFNDFEESFDLLDVAWGYAKGRAAESYKWSHIVDITTGEVVGEFETDSSGK